MKRVFAGTGLIVLLSCAGFGQTPTFGIADVHGRNHSSSEPATWDRY
jgi:hypothetical protein